MNNIGIIGAGFGLYGYLPALVELLGKTIILPARYKEKFSTRSELQKYSDYVQWVPDDSTMFDMVDSIIVAIPPSYQLELTKKLIHFQNIKNLLLEKPLAVTPDKSSQLINELILAKKRFRIGYNFRFTPWGTGVFKLLKSFTRKASFDRLFITWNFLAPHYSNDLLIWKRFNSHGGGALRFYGIHLVALLAESGYSKVLYSETFGANHDEVEKWVARFSGKNLPICEITVDSKTTNSQFSISMSSNSKKKILYKYLDPFDCEKYSQLFGGQDKRVPFLIDLFRTLFYDSSMSFDWYKKTIELWRNVEGFNTYKKC